MEKLEIIVNSCDSYCDVWKPFFLRLKKEWQEINYPILLNTESKNYSLLGLDIRTIDTHFDFKSWGDRLVYHLEATDTEYVLMLFDDYILEDKISSNRINECLEILDNDRSIAVTYLVQVNGVNLIDDNRYKEYSLIKSESDYIVNSAPGIWRKDILIEMLGRNDTPWAWEYFGSSRAYKTKYKFYSIKDKEKEIYKYKSYCGGAIHRGKWVREVIIPVIEEFNLDIDCSIRGYEQNIYAKRGFKFYLNFYKVGWKMVKIDIFIFLFRAIKKRILRLLKIRMMNG